LNQNGIRDTVFEALQFAAEKSSVTLEVNPQDFNYVERLRPEIFSRFGRLGSIVVNSDSSVTRGGCHLETTNGVVDASVEAQLERVRRSLKEAFAEGG
jgi:flagellar assembly protein FliH